MDAVSAQPFRYLGRHGVLDDGAGLCYARARYFSPQLGRFLTKDPLTGKESDGQSLNRYIYALNNPLRLQDVSGLMPHDTLTSQFNQGGTSDIDWFHRLLLPEILRNAGINVSLDSLKAIGAYFAAGGTKGVPISFSPWTWEVTGQQALPLYTPMLSTIGNVVSKGVPFVGIAVSGFMEYRETAGQNENSLQRASRVTFTIGMSALGSLAGPYGAAAISIATEPAYDYVIEPIGEWTGANVTYSIMQWLGLGP
jgi:RHS repeat-associated protein